MFTQLVYLFSNKDICKTLMHYLGSFKYTEMQGILPKLYEGFSLTDYHVEPGTILYTSINPDSEDVNLKLYKKGNKIYWPKLTRATKAPSIARSFVNKGGIFIAFELDYGMPHYHIGPDRLINTKHVFPNGAYIFPWFFFKIHKVIKHDGFKLVFAKQTSHNDQNGEELSCLLRENLSDDYKKAEKYREKSIKLLTPLFTEEIAYELLMVDKKTKIPLDSWEC